MGNTDDIAFRNGSVPLSALEISHIRSSGPGGQNVNKVATAVQLRFDAAACAEIGPAMMARLRGIAGRRMTAGGVIVITARRHRRQDLNQEDAVARLAAMLQEASEPPRHRRPTKPSKGAKERRLKEKRGRSDIKKNRQALRGTDH